jgi:hypothetical protein
MSEDLLLAGVTENVEAAEIIQTVRTLIAAHGHGRRLAHTPSGLAEVLAGKISEGICSEVRPWNRSSRSLLRHRFALAIEAVQTADPSDDLPIELLVTVLQNMASRIDNKLQQIPDTAPTTKEHTRI